MRIGYVPQEVLLFHDTVRNNVTLYEDDVSDEAVMQALQAAGAWELRDRAAGAGSRPSSASAATVSRADSASGSRSPARCCTSRAC